MRYSTLVSLVVAVASALACDSCYGPSTDVIHTRNVRRMQPGSSNATVGPTTALEWGQLNFLHTTDTHGWLEGHIKEQNYGADWGDFVSFSRHMKQKAGNLGVDLLLVDTVYSNPIFDEVDYDVLTIGNHELYISEIAYEHFYNFSKVWGEKYVTSNVQILNPATNVFEYIGKQYRYFTTAHGLRIMTFGVLFDFTGNSNVSKVIKAKDMIQQQWFKDAVNFDQPIDLFLLVGHNPVSRSAPTSTFGLLHDTIRAARPNTPIQAFGGHSHIRDFAVYDDMSTGLESGRYCETLGWLSMSGVNSTTYTGLQKPRGVANPTKPATNTSTSGLVYSRRYLDWNRLTFEYHATNSQASTFDYHSGLRVTGIITDTRKKLNLSILYGCAPTTYCVTCQPFGAPGNINTLLPIALGAAVVTPSRSTTPRIILLNTGSIRFDLVKGPFTYDDSFIVSPFTNIFQFIPDVPYDIASKLLANLNGATTPDKRSSANTIFGSMDVQDSCVDPAISRIASVAGTLKSKGVVRRQTTVTPGYITTDDFGTDGDDTPHSFIPSYAQPTYIQGNASLPMTGTPAAVDVIFTDYLAPTVVAALNQLGGTYTTSNVSYYNGKNFTTQNYLPNYAKKYWQANVPNCPVGQGVGFPT